MRALDNSRPVCTTERKNSSFKVRPLECTACYVRDAPKYARSVGGTDIDFFRGDGALEAVNEFQAWPSHWGAIWVVGISVGVIVCGGHDYCTVLDDVAGK